MSKSKFQKIAITIIIAGFIIYIIFLLFSSEFSGYQVEDALNFTVSDSITATGYVFRNETYVYSNASGSVYYELSDGEAIEKGGTIADIFSDESQALVYNRALDLENTIDSLSQISKSGDTVSADLDTLNGSVEDKIINFLAAVNSHSYIGIDEAKNALISSINQRQFAIGAEESYDDYIQQLSSELNQLRSGINTVGSITADVSGYFVSHCDGYENSVDYGDILNITSDDIDSLVKTEPSANCIGKIVTDFKWYIVAKITADDALRLAQTDSELTVDMPFASNQEIPVTVEQINQPDRQSDGVVILSCNLLSGDLIQTRTEPIQINLHTYSGLRVSKKAIHDSVAEVKNSDGTVTQQTVQGVYVLTGLQIDFKEISITYSGNDFVICDPQAKNLKTGSTIKLYDQIITEGADVYDGKIIE